MPAYGCPNLIAACVRASVRPRLVDVASAGWGYCIEELARCICPDTVAIVAVNLLGTGDTAAALRPLCRARGITLIQDSAQHLPRVETAWAGDYVVLSFGRGKPLNLLQGGALLSAQAPPEATRAEAPRVPLSARLLTGRVAAYAFNLLTRPEFYGAVTRLPGTGLGAVAYAPLRHIAPLPDRFARGASAAFEDYRPAPSYRRALWEPVLPDWRRWGIEEIRSGDGEPDPEPLRLALLAPSRRRRDALVDRLARAGLGASRLYGAELPRIAGVPDIIRTQGPFPNASLLADRLFTLPTHSLVSADTVRQAHRIVRAWCREHAAPAHDSSDICGH